MTEPDTKEILDIVIRGGRVMDPLTRTDVFADVDVKDGAIAAIVPPGETLMGDAVIDATGLVVAPGFINIHGHEGEIDVTMDVSARDGVTTVIGGNCGARWTIPDHQRLPMADYFAELEGRGIVANYAGFSGHNTLRDIVGVPDVNTPAIEDQLAVFGRTISDICVMNTVLDGGEVLMESLEPFASIEQFVSLRDRVRAGELPDPLIIGHFYPSHMIRTWMESPHVMIESDGLVEVDAATGRRTAHPRIAGSFSKFLGYWVREQGVCDLMTALAKTSTMAAVWLGLDGKGRIRVGADADLVLFDPATVIDRAGYGEGESMIPPDGIPHVIVNGKLVVRDGELTGDRPGRVLRRTRPIPGEHVHHGVLPGTGVDDLQ